MLTSVACVARADARLVALDHVPRIVSEFLDVSVLFPPSQAAATGYVSLFDRVLDRVRATGVDAVLLFHWLGQALLRAVEGGHLQLVQRIHEIHPEPLGVLAFQTAAGAGQLAILQWLCENRFDRLCIEVPPAERPAGSMTCCFSYQCEAAAKRAGHLHVLQWLYEAQYVRQLGGFGDLAAAQGDLEMVQWADTRMIDSAFSEEAIEAAAKHGHLKVVHYLHGERFPSVSAGTLLLARVGGHADVVAYLEQQGLYGVFDPESMVLAAAEFGRVDLLEEFGAFLQDEASRENAMEAAISNGHLEVAKWLGRRTVSTLSLSRAAAAGHVDVLQWVHEQDCGEWTSEVVAQAALAGHHGVVQWFHSQRRELVTEVVLDCAAAGGHLPLLKWLVDHSDAGCTTDAMDEAAANGHLEIVQWLHNEGIGTCTANAMDGAAQHGHLELLMWLHEKGYTGLSSNAMRSGSLDVVMWLHDRFALPLDPGSLIRAIALGDLQFMKWAHEHTDVRVSSRLVRLVLPLGHTNMLSWMRAHRPDEFQDDDVDDDVYF